MGTRNAHSVSMGHARKRARGLQGDARAGGSDEQKASSATADKAGTRGCYGAWQGKKYKTNAGGNWRGQNPWEWGETTYDSNLWT